LKNKLLNLILAFAIVIQSFVAIANSQETHELDVQHIQTEHSHESDRQIVDNELPIEGEHSDENCHHCGHCHGFHSQWLTKASIDHDKLVAHQYLYSFQYANPHHDNPIIPPIS
tara:strand:+ start:423 stop:764 length:342 start_codon:yes stop_codon:yes gene_type:complete